MSCMPLIKLAYGLHKPRYVSDAEVVKYSNRLGLQDEIYRLKDYYNVNQSNYRYLGNSFPDVLLFNSAGQLAKFETNCSSGLDSMVKLSTHEIDNISTEGKTLRDFINDTYIINKLNNENITVLNMPVYVVKFADYAGRLNKDNVPGLVEQLECRKDVQYIILNMDYSVPK